MQEETIRAATHEDGTRPPPDAVTEFPSSSAVTDAGAGRADAVWAATTPPLDITFLDRNGIRITGNWFAVPGRRYSVRDLNEIWTVAGPRNPLGYSALKAAGVVILVALIASPELDTVAAWVGVVAVLAVPLTVALAALRLRPRPMSLWARYRGRTEQLIESGNPTWFRQVCRALNRAREYNRP